VAADGLEARGEVEAVGEVAIEATDGEVEVRVEGDVPIRADVGALGVASRPPTGWPAPRLLVSCEVEAVAEGAAATLGSGDTGANDVGESCTAVAVAVARGGDGLSCPPLPGASVGGEPRPNSHMTPPIPATAANSAIPIHGRALRPGVLARSGISTPERLSAVASTVEACAMPASAPAGSLRL